ncbi:MAG: DUF4352 domain-containing protein [Candidatus Nezhaarchaeota archaeon]|nr:DUF4352 domain-containing protein [Candidatus Nezhaarchaeota archaeon]
MRGTPLRDEKAVSPVIATIIIVAVAIVMSIAVAYWMLGLAGTFTRYEKIEFVAAYVNRTINNNEYYEVVVKVRNTGSSDATINLLLVNGKIDTGVNVSKSASDNINEPLKVGESKILVITLPTETYRAGTTVELMFQTAAGNQYPKTIVLP